ncbi:hypothetical protein GpartN1_g7211.t1 [Galdieria partita]|uniref:Uncharacterized protein n=1 Tax=Galdieria partita TaxID=83374 RepID=A0A9C7Q3Z0_9RHOD|nr:hypothetical protein GpartN1_g7211.t1 [Galdieria partita]
MNQLSQASVDSELMEIQNLKRLLRKTKLQEQQYSQVYSPISSKELYQSEMDILLSETREEPLNEETNEHSILHMEDSNTTTSKTERMLQEAKSKLERARQLLSEMQQTSNGKKTNTLQARKKFAKDQNEEEQLQSSQSNPRMSEHVATTTNQSNYNRSWKQASKDSAKMHHGNHRKETESNKQSITAEPYYNSSAHLKWFQEISSELKSTIQLLKKLYKKGNDSKSLCQLESKMDQIWSFLNEQSLQHRDENNLNWFRAYQELKEEHEEVVQQLQETYDSFRNLQEEHYQLQSQHQDCYVHSQQTEDKIHYLEEQLDKLQVTYLEMQNQRDQYVEKLRKNRDEFMQVENCLDELIQMIHSLSQRLLVQTRTSRSSTIQSDHHSHIVWEEESYERNQAQCFPEEYSSHSESPRHPGSFTSRSFDIQQNYQKAAELTQQTKDFKRPKYIPRETTPIQSTSHWKDDQNHIHSESNVQLSTSVQTPKVGHVKKQHYPGGRTKHSKDRTKKQMKVTDSNQVEEGVAQLLKDEALHSRELENLERYLDQTLSTLRNFPTRTK